MTEQVTEYIKESTGRTWKEPEETRIILKSKKQSTGT